MLQLVEKNPTRARSEEVEAAEAVDADEAAHVEEISAARTRRAPSAPRSPGVLPLAYATQLRPREVLVWWSVKRRIEPRPVLAVAGVCALVLLIVSILLPSFWLQPWSSVWRPLVVLFAPAALVLAREATSRRATLVTDNAVIDVPMRGAADRLGFDAVRRVRRDLWTGGIRLDGVRHVVRIPQAHADDTRRAIASQRFGMIRASEEEPDDPLAWMP